MVDTSGDLGSNGRPAPPRRRLESRSRRPSPLDRDSLELVNGDEAGPPGKLDRLDVREQPSQGREADSERLGCLAASVREPLDLTSLAYHHSRRSDRRAFDWSRRLVCRLEMAARLVGAALLAAARHAVQAYTNSGMVLHLGASVSRLLLLYARSGSAPADQPLRARSQACDGDLVPVQSAAAA